MASESDGVILLQVEVQFWVLATAMPKRFWNSSPSDNDEEEEKFDRRIKKAKPRKRKRKMMKLKLTRDDWGFAALIFFFYCFRRINLGKILVFDLALE